MSYYSFLSYLILKILHEHVRIFVGILRSLFDARKGKFNFIQYTQSVEY